MTVLFTDSGTRANGALGANYTTTSGMDTLVISSNRFIPNNSSLDAFQFVNSVSFLQTRQYAKATTSGVFNTGGVGAGMAVGVKFATGGANTGIRLAWNMVGWELGRFNTGTFTSLASASLAIADGDAMLIDYNGTTGAWLVQKNGVTVASGSGTDASPIATGAAGVGYSSVGNGASGFINFEAGDFATATVANQAPMMPKSLRLGAGMGFGRFIQAVAAVLNNITGTAGFQNGADKLTATATETISGTAALTNGADKIVILATETFSGTAALKNGADALAATAQERFAGTAGLTGGPDKLTATGAEVFASSVALKGGPDKLAATATETISGTAALKNGADHLSATDGSTPGTTGNVPTINAPLVFGTLLNRS